MAEIPRGDGKKQPPMKAGLGSEYKYNKRQSKYCFFILSVINFSVSLWI
jgi:hypothetical protein